MQACQSTPGIPAATVQQEGVRVPESPRSSVFGAEPGLEGGISTLVQV